ncbi:hypothetical protein GEMRC1_008568 [Eukaryota sp. GEM-RC1]
MSKRISRVQELVAHTDDTNCLNVGRKSGLVFASGGKDKAVNVWTIGKPDLTLSLKHNAPVTSISFDPEEQVIAAGSDSGAIKLFDLAHESISKTFVGHRTSTTCLDFHPYGHVMVSGSRDTNIKIWDIRSRRDIFTYRGHSSAVTSVKISPHGRWVISAGADGKLKIWDITAGKVLSTLTDDGGVFTSLSFHPTDFLLASSLSASSPTEATPVTNVAFSPNGDALFSTTQTLLKSWTFSQSSNGSLSSADSVVANWGGSTSHSARVMDLLVQPQDSKSLVAAVGNGSVASIHVADLKLIAPIGKPPKNYYNSVEVRVPRRNDDERRSVNVVQMPNSSVVSSSQTKGSYPKEDISPELGSVPKEERGQNEGITEKLDSKVIDSSKGDDSHRSKSAPKNFDPSHQSQNQSQKSSFELSMIPQPKDTPIGLDPSAFLVNNNSNNLDSSLNSLAEDFFRIGKDSNGHSAISFDVATDISKISFQSME